MSKIMTAEEKLDKLTKDFSLLPEEKQDYILGVLQALVFANDMANAEDFPLDMEQNTESAWIQN
jgi:hypothetical protein